MSVNGHTIDSNSVLSAMLSRIGKIKYDKVAGKIEGGKARLD